MCVTIWTQEAVEVSWFGIYWKDIYIWIVNEGMKESWRWDTLWLTVLNTVFSWMLWIYSAYFPLDQHKHKLWWCCVSECCRCNRSSTQRRCTHRVCWSFLSSEQKTKVLQKRLGTWNKSWSVSSFFSRLLWKMVLWAEGLTLHCVFLRTTPQWHVIPYLCYPNPIPGPLTCHPDSETQLFGWSDLSVLYFSWHFVFSTCVTKALLTSLISPPFFSVINMICATLSLLPFV